ncbi:hypothetical protein [Pseudomonas ogarae]|jgi:hypothetical protein
MNKPLPEASLKNDRSPNDDGFVLGTAGRDEDPNATTDWQHPLKGDEGTTRGDTRGLPGYPNAPTRQSSYPSAETEVPDDNETSSQDNAVPIEPI